MSDNNQPDAGSLGNQTEVPQTQPSAQPAAPSAPQAQPQNPSQIQPAGPSTSAQPRPAAPTANAQPAPVSIHARIFDKILQGMSGGPRRIINPDGTVSQVNDSKVTMGRAIISAALTGLMSPSHYRDTPFGPVRDFSADAAGAAEAGQKSVQDFQSAPQKFSDEVQARKLATVQNNIKLTQSAAAMAHQGNVALDDTVKANQNHYITPIEEYEGQRTNDMPSAYASDGQGGQLRDLRAEDLIGHSSFKPTDNNVIVTGVIPVRNPQTGVMENHPTYAVLNENLRLKLNEDTVNELAKYNQSFENVYKATGGNVTMAINPYMRAVHTANSIKSVESYMSDAVPTIFGDKAHTADLAAAVKKDPSLYPSIDAVEKQLAAGHDAKNLDPTRNGPEAILDAVRNTPGGQKLLAAFGVTPDMADAWIEKTHNEKLRSAALAKEGGMGEKAPAAQPQVNALINSIQSNPDMSASDKKALMVDVPTADKDGVVRMNQGQVAKVVARQDATIATNKGIAEKNALANGDPVQLQKSASNIIEGDVNNITKIASMHGNGRVNLVNALHDEAVGRGLDPTEYSEAAIDAKADAVKSYSAAGKIGQQIASFRTFLGHESEAVAANEAWTRSNSPLLNRPMAWIAKNAADDPNYIRLKAALTGPSKEYQSFLNANRAEHEADIKQMDTMLDANSTPLQINTALREMAKTADFRLGSLGKGYQETVGANFASLLDPDSKAMLMKLVGPGATSPAYAVPLPRGWQGGKAQPMADKEIYRAYYRASGNDTAQAKNLAKKNGWIVP
jgi:hypothetical protein